MANRLFQVNLTQHVRAEQLSAVVKMYADMQDAAPTVTNVGIEISELDEEETKTE